MLEQQTWALPLSGNGQGPIYIEQMVGYESDGADKHFRTLLGQKSGIKIPGRPRNRGKEEQCSKYDVEEETRDKYFVCTCCF